MNHLSIKCKPIPAYIMEPLILQGNTFNLSVLPNWVNNGGAYYKKYEPIRGSEKLRP